MRAVDACNPVFKERAPAARRVYRRRRWGGRFTPSVPLRSSSLTQRVGSCRPKRSASARTLAPRRCLGQSRSVGIERGSLDSRSCSFVKGRSSDCPEHLPSTSSLLGSSTSVTGVTASHDAGSPLDTVRRLEPARRLSRNRDAHASSSISLVDFLQTRIECEHTVERLNLARARLFSSRAQ